MYDRCTMASMQAIKKAVQGISPKPHHVSRTSLGGLAVGWGFYRRSGSLIPISSDLADSWLLDDRTCRRPPPPSVANSSKPARARRRIYN